MVSFRYLTRRIRQMDYKQMLDKSREVAAKSGRSMPRVLTDIVWCTLRYQSGYMDYWLFEMWRLDRELRKTIFSTGMNNRYVRALNSKGEWRLFDDKIAFLKRFGKFMQRRWAVVTEMSPDELREFATSLGRFMAKPVDGTCGKGIEKLDASVVTDWVELKKTLEANGQVLLEEVVTQHPDMAAMYPGAANTVRVVTILKDGETHVIKTMLRIGAGGRPVDNFNSGGLLAEVDKATGIVKSAAVDKTSKLYESHPDTGTPIRGFQIPMWDEINAFVKQTALVEQSVKYVGWDVAVTPNGPTLIEGNPYPGNDIVLLPMHASDWRGSLPDYERVYTLKDIKRIQKG